MEKVLIEQLDEAERNAVLRLACFEISNAGYDILRNTPALPEGFTLGDAARAILVKRLDYLIRLSAASNR